MSKKAVGGGECLLSVVFGAIAASFTGSLWWHGFTLLGLVLLSRQDWLLEMLFPLRKKYAFRPVKTLASAEIPIGYSARGFQTLRFGDEWPHLLVAGQPGSGKSNFLRQVIINCILTKDRRKLKLHLIDLKAGGLEFAPFDGAEIVEDCVWTTETARETLAKLRREMERRNTLFRKNGVVKIQDYNRKYPHKALDYRICIIDEFANLEEDLEARNLLKRLLREARSAGIYFILCCQRPDRETVPGYIKHALAASLCFKVRDQVNSQIVLGYGHLEGAEIKVQGRGIFSAYDMMEVQPMLAPSEYEEIRDLIGNRVKVELPDYDFSGVSK